MPRTQTSERKSMIARAVNALYSKSAPLLLGEALFFGIIAILMVARPVAALAALTIAIGLGLIVFGLYRVIVGFAYGRGYGGGWMDVLFGAVNVILGVLFCVFPVGSMTGLVIIFVVLFVFKAIRSFILAINMARARVGHYVLDIVISGILVALGILLLIYPMAGALVAVYYIAMTMLIYAASDVFMYLELLRLRRYVKDN